MADTDPKVGQIIRYSYVWKSEARQGHEEGKKNRPCVIIYVDDQTDSGHRRVGVCPITHTPPQQLLTNSRDRDLTDVNRDDEQTRQRLKESRDAMKARLSRSRDERER